MLINGFFFLLGFATGAALVWSAVFMALALKDDQDHERRDACRH